MIIIHYHDYTFYKFSHLLCTVQKCSSLCISEVGRNRDNDIIDGHIEGRLTDVSQLGEQSRSQLLGRQLLVLSIEIDVVAHGPGVGLDTVVGDTGQLRLDVGILVLSSKKLLEPEESSFDLRHLTGLGGHADGPGLLSECHIAGGLSQGVVVGDGLDTSLSGHGDVAGVVTKIYSHHRHHAGIMLTDKSVSQ